MHIIK